MHFEVTSERPCLIDAIGEMVPGEAIKVTLEQQKLFETIHGVTLQKAKFPPDVHVTCIMDEIKTEEPTPEPEATDEQEPEPESEPTPEEG